MRIIHFHLELNKQAYKNWWGLSLAYAKVLSNPLLLNAYMIVLINIYLYCKPNHAGLSSLQTFCTYGSIWIINFKFDMLICTTQLNEHVENKWNLKLKWHCEDT